MIRDLRTFRQLITVALLNRRIVLAAVMGWRSSEDGFGVGVRVRVRVARFIWG